MHQTHSHDDNESSYYSESDVSSSSSSTSLNQVQITPTQINTITLSKDNYVTFLTNFNNLTQTLQHVKTKLSVAKPQLLTQCTQTDEPNAYQLRINTLTSQLETVTIENTVLTAEISKLQKQNQKLLSENTSLKQHSNAKIEKLLTNITSLKQSLQALTNKYNDALTQMSKMKLLSPIEQVFSNTKCIDNIIAFLPVEYTLQLCSVNNYFHSHFYYKQKCKYLQHKLKQTLATLSVFTNKDISEVYEIKHSDIQDLIDKYTNKHNIPGNNLRCQVIRSLLFIENIVRKPLRLHHEEKDLKLIFPNQLPFKDDIAVYNIIKNVFNIINPHKHGTSNTTTATTNTNVLSDTIMFPYTYDNFTHCSSLFGNDNNNYINEIDEQIYSFYMAHTSPMYVKFEYENVNQLHSLLDYFLKAQLDKEHYVKFLQCIITEYSSLLYTCYEAINEFKEIEIANIAIDARFKKFKHLAHDLQDEINDLTNYANSSRVVKEMLLKQKNEVEIKYNDSLIQLNQMQNEKESLRRGMEAIDIERMNSEKEFNVFKNKMLSEYKYLQNESKRVFNERDILKQTLIDFKNYFIENVSDEGEIIIKNK